jgi:hypothetical protein
MDSFFTHANKKGTNAKIRVQAVHEKNKNKNKKKLDKKRSFFHASISYQNDNQT